MQYAPGSFIPDGVVNFGRAVYSRGLGVRKVYEIDAVLLAVDRLGQLAFLAVVDDDLIVLAARYDVIASGREVETVDLVGVLAEHLSHLEATHHVVYQLHLGDHVTCDGGREDGSRMYTSRGGSVRLRDGCTVRRRPKGLT